MIAQQPHELIWSLTNAYVASRSLHVVAELGVADALDSEPISTAELASRCGVDADALERVMRLLAAHGVCERRDGGFGHTPASELLRSGHPKSMRAFPRMNGLPVFSATFAELEHSVRTGRPSIERIDPRGLWGYCQDHPDTGMLFGQAMTSKAAADIAAILAAYDFTPFGTIADIAGGHGHLLTAIPEAVPAAEGVLYELPNVIDKLDLEHDRLTIQAGDFFADQLPAADAYLLMEILHDWTDEDCVSILQAIRSAAKPHATLLVIENVVPDEGTDTRAQTLDVIMLAVTGGRERSTAELGALFAQAGFSQPTVTATAGPLRIVEATAEGAGNASRDHDPSHGQPRPSPTSTPPP